MWKEKEIERGKEKGLLYWKWNFISRGTIQHVLCRMHYEPLMACGIYDEGLLQGSLSDKQSELKKSSRNALCKSLYCHLMALFEKANTALVLNRALESATASSGIHSTFLTYCPSVLQKQSRGHQSSHSCCKVINYLHTCSLIHSMH